MFERLCKNNIVRNIFWLGSAEFSSRVILFVVAVAIARFLGPESYGQLSFAFAFTALFEMVMDFGFATLVVREVAIGKESLGNLFLNVSLAKLVLGLIGYAALFVVIQLSGKTDGVKTLVYFAGAFTLIQSFSQFFYAFFRGREKMQFETLSRIFYALTLLVAVFVLMIFRSSLKTIALSYVIVALAGSLFSIFLLWHNFEDMRGCFDLQLCKKLLRKALPLATSFTFMAIYVRIDISLLSFLQGDRVVGGYSAAYAILSALSYVPVILATAIFPRSSNLIASSVSAVKNLYLKFFKLLLVLAIPIALLVIVFAKQVILLTYGTGFESAVISLEILSFSLLPTFENVLLSNFLIAINEERNFTKVMLIGMVVNILTNLVLIPKYSFIGAALTTVLTELTIFVFCFYVLNRRLQIIAFKAR